MWVIGTALLWIIWGWGRAANYCNFGLCCQQPQGSPKAVMETLLSVAVHHPDGRVVVISTLPCAVYAVYLPQAQCTVPAVCPRKAEQSRQLPFLLCWSLVLLSVSVPSLHPASSSLTVNLLFPFLPFVNLLLNGLFLPKDVPKSK